MPHRINLYGTQQNHDAYCQRWVRRQGNREDFPPKDHKIYFLNLSETISVSKLMYHFHTRFGRYNPPEERATKGEFKMPSVCVKRAFEHVRGEEPTNEVKVILQKIYKYSANNTAGWRPVKDIFHEQARINAESYEHWLNRSSGAPRYARHTQQPQCSTSLMRQTEIIAIDSDVEEPKKQTPNNQTPTTSTEREVKIQEPTEQPNLEKDATTVVQEPPTETKQASPVEEAKDQPSLPENNDFPSIDSTQSSTHNFHKQIKIEKIGLDRFQVVCTSEKNRDKAFTMMQHIINLYQ